MSRVASTSGARVQRLDAARAGAARAPRSGEAPGRHARPSSSGAPRSGGPGAPGGGAGACARRPPRPPAARVRPRACPAARAVRGQRPRRRAPPRPRAAPRSAPAARLASSRAGSAPGSHSARQPGSPASRSVPREPVLAFRGRAPAPRDEARERAVSAAVCSERDEAQAVREPELAADDERQARLARGGMGPHDAGERALVGQRERGVAERLRTLDEFRRVRRAAQEREVADAVQLRIRHRASRPRELRPSRGRSRPGLRSLAPELDALARGSRPHAPRGRRSHRGRAARGGGRELRQHVRCATKRRAGPRASAKFRRERGPRPARRSRAERHPNTP